MMDSVFDMFSRGLEQLLGRAGGPLNFRLLIMPIVVSVFATRAGLKDAREGHPAFMWAMFKRATERPRLLKSAWKDVGKVFIMALVLDTAYQLTVLKAFFLGQIFIVALACAILPYILIRSLVGRFMRWNYRTPGSHGVPLQGAEERAMRGKETSSNASTRRAP